MNLSQLRLKIRLKQHDVNYQKFIAVAQDLYGDLTKDNFDKWNLILYKMEFSGKSIKSVKDEMISRQSAS